MTDLVQTMTAETSEPTSPTRTFKIYPSSAAFMTGPLSSTSKSSGCFRYLWAQQYCGIPHKEIPRDIPPEHAALGALDEFRYFTKLEKEGVGFVRESRHKVPFKNCEISFRVDGEMADGSILEKKSATSEFVLKEAIEGGQPDANYVAQLVSYLTLLKRTHGRLVISYYELDANYESYLMLAERQFNVEVLDSGVILLDSAEYPKTTKDLARWYAGVQQSLSNPSIVPPEPMQPGLKFKSPCYSCPLKKACEEYKESPATTVQYLQRAKEEFLAPRDPKKFKIKVLTERRKINREKKKGTVKE